jgi:HEAT repeat protein
LTSKLEPLLTRGGFFRRGDDDERYHAALALAWLGTPQAIDVLDRELKSKREPVRGAVERALEAVRRAAQATPGEVEEILEEAAAEEAS